MGLVRFFYILISFKLENNSEFASRRNYLYQINNYKNYNSMFSCKILCVDCKTMTADGSKKNANNNFPTKYLLAVEEKLACCLPVELGEESLCLLSWEDVTTAAAGRGRLLQYGEYLFLVDASPNSSYFTFTLFIK